MIPPRGRVKSWRSQAGQISALVDSIPEPIDPTKACMRINYRAADPANIKRTAPSYAEDPFTYSPNHSGIPATPTTNGRIRLWTKPSTSPRSLESFMEGDDPTMGYYVPPTAGSAEPEPQSLAGMLEQLLELEGGEQVAGTGETPQTLSEDFYGPDAIARLGGTSRQFTLYLEAVDVSRTLADQLIRFEIDPDGEGPAGFVVADVVHVTAVRVDLDIDSDNNNGLDQPDRSEAEETIEDDPARPGKVIAVNDDDTDDDGIPDFADGFDLDGLDGTDDDTCLGEQFVPLELEIPAGVDFSKLKIRFVYDASDPQGVQVTSTASGSAYAPASGSLRLWTTVGDYLLRRKASISSGGDYVDPRPQGFAASDLGLSSGNRTMTLWAEAVRPSTSLADLQVTVEIDPDGEGPAGFIAADAAGLTAVGIRLAEVDETGLDTRPATNFAYSNPTPTVHISYATLSNIGPGPDGTRIYGDVILSVTVDSAVADIIKGDLGKIDTVDVYVNGLLLPIGASILNVTKTDNPNSFLKPFDYEGRLTGMTFQGVELQEGVNTIAVVATDKVYGQSGFETITINLAVTPAVQPPPVDPYGNRLYLPQDQFSPGDFHSQSKSLPGDFHRYMAEIVGPAQAIETMGYVPTARGDFYPRKGLNGKYYLSTIAVQLKQAIQQTQHIPNVQRFRLKDGDPTSTDVGNGMTEITYTLEKSNFKVVPVTAYVLKPVGTVSWESLGEYKLVVPTEEATHWKEMVRRLITHVQDEDLYADLKDDEAVAELSLRMVPFGSSAIAFDHDSFWAGMKSTLGESLLFLTPAMLARPVRAAGQAVAISERAIVAPYSSILRGGSTEVATRFGQGAQFVDGGFTNIGNPHVATLPLEGFSATSNGVTIRTVGEAVQLGKGEIFVNGWRTITPAQVELPAAELTNFLNPPVAKDLGTVTLYRYYGGISGRVSSWVSRTRYATAAEARNALALPPENTVAFIAEVHVPAGTVGFEGQAASQFGLPGFGNQIFIPRDFLVDAWFVPIGPLP